MEAILGLAGTLTFIVSCVVLILFVVLCYNIGTLVRLVRYQNEILTALFKQQGGEIEENRKR